MRLLAIGSLLGILAVLTGPAWAESAPAPAASANPVPGSLGGGGPLNVSAQKSLEYHQKDHMYLARGQARATRGDVTIAAEELAAYERSGPGGKNEIYKMTARQNVVITSGQQQIFGDDGSYDADRRMARLTGGALRFVSSDTVVTAREALEYWLDKKQAVARGQTVAIRDGRRVEADRMIAQFAETPKGGMELRQLTADGHVTITTDTDVARGDKAVYDLAHNVAILSGRVRVTRGASQLNGSVAEVDFKTGISRMTSGSGDDNRVQALFVPGADQSGLPIPATASPSP